MIGNHDKSLVLACLITVGINLVICLKWQESVAIKTALMRPGISIFEALPCQTSANSRTFAAISSDVDQRISLQIPSTGYATYIDSISLQKWGVFHQAKLKLPAGPGLIAITGETGAGKSVFLAALQYITATSSNARVTKTNSMNNEASIVELLLVEGDAQPKFRAARRSYAAATKKSNCELDGAKVLVKMLQQEMKNKIRFWSSEAINKLDSADFMEYIDRNAGKDYESKILAVSNAHKAWIKVKEDLEHLESLESKANNAKEVELLTSYSNELKVFFNKQRSLQKELLDTLSDINVTHDVHLSDDEGENINNFNGGEIESLNLSKLVDLLSMTMESQDEAPLTWIQLCAIESFMKKYTKATIESGFRKLSPSAAAAAATNNFGGVGSIKEMSLKPAIRQIEMYQKELRLLHNNIEEMGMLTSKLSSKLESAFSLLEEASTSLNTVNTDINSAMQMLPDLSVLVARLTASKNEWDMLSRKHSTIPSKLTDLYVKMNNDISIIHDLWTLLPKQKQQENIKFENYVSAAKELTLARIVAAEDLMNRLNSLLPELDMSDKRFHINFKSVAFMDALNSDYHDDIKIWCSENGWDKIELCLVSSSHYAGQDAIHLVKDIDVGGGESLSCLYVDAMAFEDDDGDTSDIREASHHSKKTSETEVRDSLSSGECARLALALETLSDQSALFADNYSDEEYARQVLVFDEIDAHIGGDAAVAVARLLRQQGKSRQILIVTHNPVIAAAATSHILVQRQRTLVAPTTSAAISKGKGALTEDFVPSSTIKLLETREEREKELARMATGRLNVEAGLDLARALLNTSFDTP